MINGKVLQSIGLGWMVALALALVGARLTTVASAQDTGSDGPVEIQKIKSELDRMTNEVVVIDGFVTQFELTSTGTTQMYWLKDNWGGLILVRTSGTLPQMGTRYSVQGVVTKDATRNGQPVILEQSRSPIIDGVDGGGGNNGGGFPMEYVLVFAGIAFILLLAALLWILRSRSVDTTIPKTPIPGNISLAETPPLQTPPAPTLVNSRVTESRTIKMQTPAAATVKMLPGYLEVLGDDGDLKEIRLFHPPGDSTPEITFGRAEGRALGHVQLKPETVSKRQAALAFEDGDFRLVNYSDVNATRVDNTTLGVNESCTLSGGELIEMGEVRFRFHRTE